MKYYLYFVLIVILTSCELSTVVDVELPDSEPQLVAHINTRIGLEEQTFFEVTEVISQLEFSSKLDQSLVNPLLINITKGDTVQLEKDNLFGKTTYFFNNNKFSAGDQAKLLIDYPDRESLEAMEIVPFQPNEAQFEFKDGQSTVFDEENLTDLALTFKDEPGINYYRISASITETLVSLDALGDTLFTETYNGGEFNEITSNDPSIISINQSILVSDNSFEGQSKVLDLSLLNFLSGLTFIKQGEVAQEIVTGSGVIIIESITESLYRFLVSKDNADNGGGPFSTPISVYTNMENGRGNFSFSNGKVYDVSYQF